MHNIQLSVYCCCCVKALHSPPKLIDALIVNSMEGWYIIWHTHKYRHWCQTLLWIQSQQQTYARSSLTPQINNQEEETCWIISTVVVVIHNPNCYFILLQKMEQNTLFLTAIQVYFFNNTLSLFHRTYIYYCNYFNIVDCVNID